MDLYPYLLSPMILQVETPKSIGLQDFLSLSSAIPRPQKTLNPKPFSNLRQTKYLAKSLKFSHRPSKMLMSCSPSLQQLRPSCSTYLGAQGTFSSIGGLVCKKLNNLSGGRGRR